MALERTTLIRTPEGVAQVGDLKVGDSVFAYRNGSVVCEHTKNPQSQYYARQQISAITVAQDTSGLLIETRGGKSFVATKDQQTWAKDLHIADDEYIVYVMWRPDMGYRVGKTNKTAYNITPYGGRARAEGAHKLWIIRTASCNEDAILYEELYSLKYGIPTAVFRGKDRGLNQDRINTIFAECGQNGEKLIRELQYSFDNPHWMIRAAIGRSIVHVAAHNQKMTNISAEWSSEEVSAKLKGTEFEPLQKLMQYTKRSDLNSNKRYRLSINNSKYAAALKIAHKLSEAVNTYIDLRLSNPTDREYPLRMLNASQLFPTQEILVLDGNGGMVCDTITRLTPVDNTTFYDIKVDDAGNTFANDCLIGAQ